MDIGYVFCLSCHFTWDFEYAGGFCRVLTLSDVRVFNGFDIQSFCKGEDVMLSFYWKFYHKFNQILISDLA